MKAQPNEHGVTWAPSKSGKLQIAVAPATTRADATHVHTLWTGTHDVGPGGETFKGANHEARARAHANHLWETQ